jgi:hypothetical protein
VDWPLRFVVYLQAHPNPDPYGLISPWGLAVYRTSPWGNVGPGVLGAAGAGAVGLAVLRVENLTQSRGEAEPQSQKGHNFLIFGSDFQTEQLSAYFCRGLRETLLVLLPLGLLASPYVMVYHVIYAAPAAARLAGSDRRAGVLLAGIALVDLVMFWSGRGFFLWPVYVLAAALFAALRPSSKLQEDER